MRCEACNERIVLAKRCPYCGHVQQNVKRGRSEHRRPTDGADGHQSGKQGSNPRGEFKGRVDGHRESQTRGAPTPTLGMVLRYLMDPHVPPWRKWALYLAIFYVLSPLDIIPGALIPVLGWLDDLAIIGLAWNWLKAELRRTYPS